MASDYKQQGNTKFWTGKTIATAALTSPFMGGPMATVPLVYGYKVNRKQGKGKVRSAVGGYGTALGYGALMGAGGLATAGHAITKGVREMSHAKYKTAEEAAAAVGKFKNRANLMALPGALAVGAGLAVHARKKWRRVTGQQQ